MVSAPDVPIGLFSVPAIDDTGTGVGIVYRWSQVVEFVSRVVLPSVACRFTALAAFSVPTCNESTTPLKPANLDDTRVEELILAHSDFLVRRS